MLADLDSLFLLDPKQVIYKRDKESLLWTGRFVEVYHGEYKGHPVAVKLYTSREDTTIGKSFKELHLESNLMQQLHYPCLVSMVDFTAIPTMSLVLYRGGSRRIITYSITLRTVPIQPTKKVIFLTASQRDILNTQEYCAIHSNMNEAIKSGMQRGLTMVTLKHMLC